MTELPEGPWDVPDLLHEPKPEEKKLSEAEKQTIDLAQAVFNDRSARVNGETVTVWEVVPDDTRSSISGYGVVRHGDGIEYYVVGRGTRNEIGLLRVTF